MLSLNTEVDFDLYHVDWGDGPFVRVSDEGPYLVAAHLDFEFRHGAGTEFIKLCPWFEVSEADWSALRDGTLEGTITGVLCTPFLDLEQGVELEIQPEVGAASAGRILYAVTATREELMEDIFRRMH